jgi:AhpD family alkylhydroperoxidase
MSVYTVHTVDTAPEASQPLLQTLERTVGMVPNLAAAMAESPELLQGFLAAREIFYGGTFTPEEIQILALTNAFENGCRYCMALHSTFALRVGVSPGSVAALREGHPPDEPRLKALSEFSRALVQKRGHVSDADLQQLLAAGYSRAQALEVVLGVAVSILPNYAHQLTQCPVDEPFRAQSWAMPAVGAAR